MELIPKDGSVLNKVIPVPVFSDHIFGVHME